MREPRARVEENHGISANPSHRPSGPGMTCGNSRDRLTAICPLGEIGGCFPGTDRGSSENLSQQVLTCGNSVTWDRFASIPRFPSTRAQDNRSPVPLGGQSDGDQQLDQDHAAGLDRDHQLANGVTDWPAPPDPRNPS